jgi:hypothetical protein
MNRKVTAQFEADGRVRLSGRCVDWHLPSANF